MQEGGAPGYREGLNEVEPIGDRLQAALQGARQFDLAVAYAKSSGTGRLLQSPIPRGSRAVVGLGFGLTDPPAVEQLAATGLAVRCVAEPQIGVGHFHPKLYLASRDGELVVLSGSANLTGGGLKDNVEQYEELSVPDPSALADRQRARFERLWDHGVALETLRRSGDWEEYRQRARDRRLLEREDRRRLLRLDAQTGRFIGRLLARPETREKAGYLGITDRHWWTQQLHNQNQADRALFWRKSTNAFRALGRGGLFFHLVKHSTGQEELRAVEGFSIYPGVYETGEARELWRRYGTLLGVERVSQISDVLGVQPDRTLGIIHLEEPTQFDRPVPIVELRANGIPFAPNIVSGRSLTLPQVAKLLQLGGMTDRTTELQAAAERPGGYDSFFHQRFEAQRESS